MSVCRVNKADVVELEQWLNTDALGCLYGAQHMH